MFRDSTELKKISKDMMSKFKDYDNSPEVSFSGLSDGNKASCSRTKQKCNPIVTRSLNGELHQGYFCFG